MKTGFAELDQALSGGWPVGLLIEVLTDFYGIGELGLLMPALKGLSDRTRKNIPGKNIPGKNIPGKNIPGKNIPGKNILFIAPPYIPYAPAFLSQGINISRLLVAHCRHKTEASWVAEQALRSGACSAVLVWLEDCDDRSLRRLQLAAEEGAAEGGAAGEGAAGSGCWAMLFRPARFRAQRSPAALRIHLKPGGPSRIGVNIFKNRGGRPHELELPAPGYCSPAK